MIRIVIGLFGFAVVLCLAIVMRAGGGDEVALVDVTRAAPDGVLRPIPEVAPAAPNPASVTRHPVEELAQGMLDRPAPALVAQTPRNDAMQDMTAGVLAGLGQPTRSGTPPVVQTSDQLKIALIQALGEGRDAEYIRALLTQALSVPGVEIPDSLITARGRIDLNPYLTQGATPPVARPVLPQPQPVVATGPRVYVVQPGDSLGGIAEQFYGDAGEFVRIFAANRRALPTADSIRPGQELIIPE